MDPDARYPDADFAVSDADIEDYYDTHQEEFEVPARATVRFTTIDKTATAADTASSRERAASIRQEVLDGAEFAVVATRESADPATATLGGDLGVFTPGRMIQPFDSVKWQLGIDIQRLVVRVATKNLRSARCAEYAGELDYRFVRHRGAAAIEHVNYVVRTEELTSFGREQGFLTLE
jgi:hypothetical protein